MRQADRAQPPHKYEIAMYWHEREPGFVPDIKEPGCFACDWHSERWPEAGDGDARLRRLWGATRGLTICHLTPHALGGSSEVRNLVLLCRDCHSAAPDFLVPDYMLKWMRSRDHWLDREVGAAWEAFKEAASAFGLTDEDREELLAAARDPGFGQFCRETIIAVPAASSLANTVSTCLAACLEYSTSRPGQGELFGVSRAGFYRHASPAA